MRINSNMKLKLTALFCLVLLAGGFRQADWPTVKSTEENFLVSMPDIPKQRRTRISGPLGKGHHIYKLEHNGITYTVSNSVFEKAPTQPEEIKQTLDFARDLLVTLSSGKLLVDKDISLDGFPGRQIRVEKGKKVWTLRAYVVKTRMYQLMTTEQKGKEQSAEAEKFFQSFAFVSRP
jgi:hypothetical protein